MGGLTFDIILDSIINHINITYSRFGDGEWNCIIGKKGKNCDGHIYFKDMALNLKNILLSNPEYYTGLQNYAVRKLSGNETFDGLVGSRKWEDNEIFTKASKGARINELTDALKTRYVIQVGNKNLRELRITPFFVEIPKLNCWLDRERILYDIKKLIKKDCVIIYSAGMPTKWFIDQLYSKDITQLDCGSVFDFYAGINSRVYMKGLKV